MVQIVKGSAFTGSGIELTSLFGGTISAPWRQVKEFRGIPLGFTMLGFVDGRRFITVLSGQEIQTLIGILREASDARILGFKESSEG